MIKQQFKLFSVVHIFSWSVCLMVFLPLAYSHAEDAAQVLPKASKRDKVNVLDFEGEVIEGERKKPDLILQVAPQDLSFENLLYNRSDFNDFLEVDQNTRPRFIIKSKK